MPRLCDPPGKLDYQLQGSGEAWIGPNVVSGPKKAGLKTLAAVDERKCRVIEMRFFGGMTVEETAEVLHVSTDTVKRDWRLAKLWLLKEMDDR